MDQVKIQFVGFSPSDFVRGYFQHISEAIHDEAPSWSSVRAVIRKTGGTFGGFIRVTSHAGEFFVSASAGGITELGRRLQSRMRRRLGRWKSRRFSNGRGATAALRGLSTA